MGIRPLLLPGGIFAIDVANDEGGRIATDEDDGAEDEGCGEADDVTTIVLLDVEVPDDDGGGGPSPAPGGVAVADIEFG